MILRAPVIVTMDGPPIEDGGVVIAGNRITAVGPFAEIERAESGPVVDLEGLTLTQSDLVFVDTYLRNFDHVKSRLEALLESYLEEETMVKELLALSVRNVLLCLVSPYCLIRTEWT